MNSHGVPSYWSKIFICCGTIVLKKYLSSCCPSPYGLALVLLSCIMIAMCQMISRSQLHFLKWITVLVLVSLCKGWVLICASSTKAINADEWPEMVSLFQTSLNRKFPLSHSTFSLHHFDRDREFHTSLLSLWNSSLLISVSNREKRKEKKVWRKLVCTHINAIFHSSFNCHSVLPGT